MSSIKKFAYLLPRELLNNSRNSLVPRLIFTHETLTRAFKIQKQMSKFSNSVQLSWISLLRSKYFA